MAVITGTLPPSPAGLWTPPYIADVTKSNSRYLSLSAYDLNVPGPVLQTLFDRWVGGWMGALPSSFPLLTNPRTHKNTATLSTFTLSITARSTSGISANPGSTKSSPQPTSNPPNAVGT